MLGGLTRESDFDRIFFLKTNGVLTTLSDKRGMVLRRNFECLRGFVGLRKKKISTNFRLLSGTYEALNLCKDTLLGLFDVLLSSRDL